MIKISAIFANIIILKVSHFFSLPFSTLSIWIDQDKTIRLVAKVSGSTTHQHSLSYAYTKKDNIIDDYTFIANENYAGEGYQTVEILEAPGLSKVHLAYFSNGIKQLEYSEIAAPSSKKYKFFLLQTNTTCKFYIDRFDIFSYSLYKSTDPDPFSANLLKLSQKVEYDLRAGEVTYLRLSHSIQSSSTPYNLLIQVMTLQQNGCGVTKCPYSTSTGIYGPAQGQDNLCACLGQVHNWEANNCLNCASSASYATLKACTSLYGEEGSPVCGNGVKETGESCDNRNQTGCKNCAIDTGYSCSEDANKLSSCTQSGCGDSKKESNQECDNGGGPGCTNCRIDPGYNCIHNLYSKSLCLPTCGDGIRAISEECDNKNGFGCFNCKTVPGYKCTGAIGSLSDCKISCGDSKFGGSQQCDNGNQIGCSTGCVPDKGYFCKNELGSKSDCLTVCGDGIKAGNQECDNGKKIGCLSCTQADDGYACTGGIGQKSVCKSVCGDSKRQPNEQCDNGNEVGCSKNCLIDAGFACTGGIGQKSACTTKCGDSIKAGLEQCDNGKKKGCSNCAIEQGYTCKLASNMKASICNKN